MSTIYDIIHVGILADIMVAATEKRFSGWGTKRYRRFGFSLKWMCAENRIWI